MNMTCSNRVIKHIMFVFNFIFVITGIIILGVGASVKAHYYPYDTFLDNNYFSLPNMLIATGSLIFFISLLGCYGAIKENWIILMVFSVLLTIIFIFELSAGIAGYTLRDRTSSFLKAKLFDTLGKYTTSPAISSMWDVIQEETFFWLFTLLMRSSIVKTIEIDWTKLSSLCIKLINCFFCKMYYKFQCCGVIDYNDWKDTFHNKSLPVSCCPQFSGIVGAFYCNSYTSETEITTETTTVLTSTTIKTTLNTEITTELTLVTESTSQKTTVPVLENLSNTTTTPYPPSSSQPYTSGCLSEFGNFIKKHAVDLGAVGVALAVIQLVGIILSFYLARQLKNGYYST